MSGELAAPTQDLAPSDVLRLFNQFLAQLQTPVPIPSTLFSGNIDPALGNLSATSVQPPTSLTSPLATVPASSHGTEKRQCRGRNLTCRGVVPGACTNCMCKGCCEAEPTLCVFKNHNGGKRPVTASHNPAHLPRPLPSMPYLVASVLHDSQAQAPTTTPAPPLPGLTPTSEMDHSTENSTSPAIGLQLSTGAVTTTTMPLSQPSQLSAPSTFSFKKPVPADLKEDYIRQCRERDKRRKIESLKARHQVKIKQSVTLFAYLGNDELPIMRPLQGILSWPALNFSEIHSDLAVLFGLPLSTILELEVLIAVNGIKSWIPVTLDFSMSVSLNDSIYLRRVGCSAGPGATPLALCAATGTTTPRKRKLLDSPTTDRPNKSLRMHSLYSSLPSSPSPTPLTPRASQLVDIFSESSPAEALASGCQNPTGGGAETLMHSTEPDAPNWMPPQSPVEHNDRDDLWSQGYVTTPTGSHLKWPQGMYVRDMAEGFDILAAGRASGASTLLERFPAVFRGMPWVSATYQKNRKFWNELAPEVRYTARNLPRTNMGLWEVWRKTQPSWRS
ncbi:hypothetical protein CVT24_013324 [Panaeolus cyanescens]|uniref:Uncharacterized protein n=1 Tax=Panaeolus cyanescens TaxID=181874 RepID=A0A409YMI0_9AGAR|nr:hypothetical protein CVT24_013324 [Panaeolus cyanescens]